MPTAVEFHQVHTPYLLENIIRKTLSWWPNLSFHRQRFLCKLHFADDIDLMKGSNSELQDLTDRLTNSENEYGIESSTDMIKVMVDTNDYSKAGIYSIYENSCKYLAATISTDSSYTSDIRISIATATATMAGLDSIWRSSTIRCPCTTHRACHLASWMRDLEFSCWDRKKGSRRWRPSAEENFS